MSPTPRQALKTLISMAHLTEEDKARIIRMVDDMTDSEVQKMGELFARAEMDTQNRITKALQDINATLQTLDANAE